MTRADTRPDLHDPWAVDPAIEVLPWDAPRPLWLDARRRGLGGSDVSALMGLSQYNSPISLWLDKTGRFVDDTDSGPAEWGRRQEPMIAEWFTDETGIETRRAGLHRSLDHPVMFCNPDRLTERAGLEIKTLEWHTEHLWDDDQVPDHAELQAQWCMAVTGRPGWWIVGLVNGRRPHLRFRERDQALIDTLTDYAVQWWNDYVVADEMPPLDDTIATSAAVKGWMGVAEPGKVIGVTDELLDLYVELSAAKEAAALADAAVVGIDSRIRLAIGDADVVARDPDAPVDDTKAGKDNTLIAIRNDGPFSPKAFAESHPTLAAAFTRQAPVLDRKALADEHPDEFRAHRARVIRPRRRQLDELLTARAAAGTTDQHDTDNTPGSK